MRAFLASLFLATVLQAAPVPKPTDRDKVEAKFGKIVDPRKDTDFKMDGDTLVVTLPGKVEKDAYIIGTTSSDLRLVMLTCPFIKLGEVKGDFEVA